MAFHSLWIFPLLATGFAIAAFVSGYLIAVGNKDAKAWFMYISDGGATPPESCIFGQLLNLSAVFLAISCYLRHRQYIVYYSHYYKDKEGWWKTISFLLMLLGYFSSFGISLVANFQETSVAVVHFIGAMIAFFGATLYCWGQILLSYALVPRMTPLWINHLRTLLTLLATAALILHMICEHAAPFVKTVNGIKPTEPSGDQIKKYDYNSPFYTNHIVTTCAEWGLALSLEAVILTFAWELREFYMHLPKMHIKPSYLAFSSVFLRNSNTENRTNVTHIEYTNENSDNSIETVNKYTIARYPNDAVINGHQHYGTILPRAKLSNNKISPEINSKFEYT